MILRSVQAGVVAALLASPALAHLPGPPSTQRPETGFSPALFLPRESVDILRGTLAPLTVAAPGDAVQG